MWKGWGVFYPKTTKCENDEVYSIQKLQNVKRMWCILSKNYKMWKGCGVFYPKTTKCEKDEVYNI